MISERLMKKGVTTVRHLLELVGAKMDDAVSLARRLEVQSLQIVGLMLTKFKRVLSEDDKRLLNGGANGLFTPDEMDHFFRLCIRPQLKGFQSPGPFLEKEKYPGQHWIW